MRRRVKLGGLLFSAALAISPIPALAAPQLLTTAAEIRSLATNEAAMKIPVSVTGVVTLARADWGGRFFVQDSTGGVFVNSRETPPPAPGDLVAISGLSDPGGYTPDISAPHWQKLATADLPAAKVLSAELFLSGRDDGNRVEVSGLVKNLVVGGTLVGVEIQSDSHRIKVFPPSDFDSSPLLGAKIRVRGVAGASFDARRRLTGVVMFVARSEDIIVEQLPALATTNDVLTTAARILSLQSNQAAGNLPVSLTGVVTAAQPSWKGNFIVQDPSGGIFVNSGTQPAPLPGDLVQVDGVTQLGGYAPDIVARKWTKLGQGALPEARPVSIDRFMSGAEDCERIELSCVLRSALLWSDHRWGLDLAAGGYEFQAFAPPFTSLNPQSLAGASVRIRGTAAASFNGLLRQRVSVVLFTPRESDLIVDQLPNDDLSKLPLTPLNAIAQYRRNFSSDTRVRVKGVVTYQRPYSDIFLHDETGGLEIVGNDTNVFSPGETVEAIGFPNLKNFLPIMEDAVLVRQNYPPQPVTPEKVSLSTLLKGFHNSDYISVQGKLLYRSVRQTEPIDPSDETLNTKILTLQSEGHIFSVEAPDTDAFVSLNDLPIGSTLDVSGICLSQVDVGGRILSVQILLRSASEIQIVQWPDWWTPRRLLMGLGILLVVSFFGAVWTMTILRKNAALRVSIAEKAKAQAELQKAHDLLETRVVERTNQLKVEISARQETEVKFNATLAERTRIAQELHDTLLQGFAGIGLKLEVVTNSLPDSLASQKAQLQKILEQSDEYVDEARQAVWEMRSPVLENNGDFPGALKKVSERALLGTDLRLQFETSGQAGQPAPAIEDNLLRICEEAVTNSVKHARATRVDIKLEYAPDELRLRIRDDGCGFNPHGPEAQKPGHFGIIGIRERAKSIGGTFSLNSRPGLGTEILVAVRRAA